MIASLSEWPVTVREKTGALLFRVVPTAYGEELHVHVGDAAFRWWLPRGLPSQLGACESAVERTLVAGAAGEPFLDEGVCLVRPLDLEAPLHFLASYRAGALNLSLAGTSFAGSLEMVRITGFGDAAGWSIRCLATHPVA